MTATINPRLLQSEPMQRCVLGECHGACCLHGVWVDSLEAQIIRSQADLIRPYMPEEFADPILWFDGTTDMDEYSPSKSVEHSTVVEDQRHYGGTACVFLRSDHRCALQTAADAAGLHPWQFKPFYCILHPLDLDEQGRITLDETKLLLEEEGSCLRPAAQPIPLLITFEPELRYLLGNPAYQKLREQIR